MISGLESPTEGEIYIDDTLVFSSEKGGTMLEASADLCNLLIWLSKLSN